MTSLRIQLPGRFGSAQARTTSSYAVSTLISNRRQATRSERLTRSAPSGRTPRGSGDHQPMAPRRETGIGNRPAAVRREHRARLEVGADPQQLLPRARRRHVAEAVAGRQRLDRRPPGRGQGRGHRTCGVTSSTAAGP